MYKHATDQVLENFIGIKFVACRRKMMWRRSERDISSGDNADTKSLG